MSLFNSSDLNYHESSGTCLIPEAKVLKDESDISFISCKASEVVKRLKEICPGNNRIDFCTAGEFSMHHVLEYLVQQNAPVDVYLCSWTIKEEPARLLYALKQMKLIKGLYCIFDYRMKTLDAKHFHFLEKVADKIVLTKNHAKAMVIVGESISYCVTGSANFSNNPRIEIGSITSAADVVEFHLGWMNKVLNGKKVY